MKGIELRAAKGMMAAGLDSALKGMAAGLDRWRKAAHHCGSGEG
jgi:hypothetical protein